MDQENTLVIIKSRCPKLAGGVFPKPAKELADVLKEWLGGVQAKQVKPEPPKEAPMTMIEPKIGGAVNGSGGVQTVAVLTEELAAIWKRMCSPRGVVEESDVLKASVEALAGSAGVAEYYRILRQHHVDRPRQFQSAQPARLCAKDVYVLLEQLRSNVRENQRELLLAGKVEAVGAETVGQAG
jgi:hypothetical protein